MKGQRATVMWWVDQAFHQTHLQNGDFLLFNDNTGVNDPFDSSFEEHEAMRMSDDSHEHANTHSSSSRSWRRPRRRPKKCEECKLPS
mmetsp:Transcript_3082/g.6250  ORF Transcript_3082/g.6250 Transcript_3082/m.6250 type:complete len:87 (+) Transcript_3082:203-463(+)